MNLSYSEKLVHSVLQLEILDKDQKMTGSATGFIVAFLESETSRVPVIVTNRHVFEKAAYIGVTFTAATEEGLPDIGKTVSTTIDAVHAIMHPNESVDLALLPIADALNRLHKAGHKPFYAYLQTNLIPTEDDWNNMDAVEPVIMAGYPRGMRDVVNNFPVVRSGITATPPKYNYMGKPEFLVDMPCFEGCSGSPVFILEEGSYLDKRTHSFNVGKSRIFLLGIQHAIPLSQATGTLATLPSDDSVSIKPVMPLYLNIGYIIKSSALLDFEPIMERRMGI